MKRTDGAGISRSLRTRIARTPSRKKKKRGIGKVRVQYLHDWFVAPRPQQEGIHTTGMQRYPDTIGYFHL